MTDGTINWQDRDNPSIEDLTDVEIERLLHDDEVTVELRIDGDPITDPDDAPIVRVSDPTVRRIGEHRVVDFTASIVVEAPDSEGESENYARQREIERLSE